MKFLPILFVVLTLLVVTSGTPISTQRPEIGHLWGSARPLLPMTFSHLDHKGQNCIDCHHNYVDNTGSGLCMNCHVTDSNLQEVLRQQFHDLCMGCHVEKQRQGQDHGPTRRCMECHLAEDRP